MWAGLAESSVRLSGACFVRAAAGLVPTLLCEQFPVSARGETKGPGWLGLGSASVQCHAGAWAALAGTGVFLLQ